MLQRPCAGLPHFGSNGGKEDVAKIFLQTHENMLSRGTLQFSIDFVLVMTFTRLEFLFAG